MRPLPLTIVYDGRCGFCRRWIGRLQRADVHGRLIVLPFQTPDLTQRFPTLSTAECARRLHAIDARGDVYRGAAAVREALKCLPFGRVLTIPFNRPLGGMWVADHLYDWIAHRWGPLGPRQSGRDESCTL